MHSLDKEYAMKRNRNQKGFTLIELLIVVVIIGILASIAIPRFGATRERAFVSAMQSDLRNVMTIEEQWYANPASNYSYSDNQAQLGITPSEGVTVDITVTDGQAYTATASHASTDITCTVTVTTDPAVPSGVITCSDQVAAPADG
jgi:type IV pilus assembly protein PilA